VVIQLCFQLSEVKDPVLQTIGMKRLSRSSFDIWFLSNLAAMTAGSALYGITKDKITAMREILPVRGQKIIQSLECMKMVNTNT
jgi:hypothetical protein